MCATCTTHLILLDLITPIIFGEKGTSWSSSFCNLCQFPVNLYFLGPNISCRTRFWKPFEPLSFRQCERPSSPPYKETGIHYGFYWHSYYCQTQKTFNNVSNKQNKYVMDKNSWFATPPFIFTCVLHRAF
jgi:hypothetical protein